MSFIKQFFNDGFESLEKIDKKSYRHLLNLSSNESQSAEYQRLFSEFIKYYDPAIITKYPVFRAAHNEACSYHSVERNQLMLTPGSDFAINLVMNAIGKNTQGLVTHHPNYNGYQHYAALQNMQIRLVANISESTVCNLSHHLVAITNPEGFLGTVMTFAQIEKIAKICQLNNNILVIDEAYIEFNTFNHCELINVFDNVIIIRSYSKGMGLASMRIGALMASSNILDYLSRFASENSISDISLEYLRFLLKKQQRMKEINLTTCHNRDLLISKLRTDLPEWDIYTTHTNFITIATRSIEEATQTVATLLDNGIRIRRLVEFNSHLHCIRITVPPVAQVSLLFDRLFSCYSTSVTS